MRNFLIRSKNVDRDSIVWNIIGSLLQAFQSVFILMVLTRQLGLTEAGIFTIAYANANLFLSIGNYGMRNYQVTDVAREFSFGTYRCSRWVTSLGMICVSVVYAIMSAFINGYSINKTIIIILMCFYRASDAYEDVYIGFYQQNGRLDIGTKCLSIRTFFSILTYILVTLVSKNQIYAVAATVIISYGVMIMLILNSRSVFDIDMKFEFERVLVLLRKCFPLFMGAFLSFYIGNAPKYAIDSQLSDEIQACYGFIAMPVFVIGLLNNFIFNPLIYKLSCLWQKGKIEKFVKIVLIQVFVIFIITICCILGAYIMGIPVLSIIYGTDLTPYLTELLLLLGGGGFLALSGLLNTMIIILRKEKAIAYVYSFVAVLAFCFSNLIVKNYGIFGASILYTLFMALVSTCFMFVFIWAVFKRKREAQS